MCCEELASELEAERAARKRLEQQMDALQQQVSFKGRAAYMNRHLFIVRKGVYLYAIQLGKLHHVLAMRKPCNNCDVPFSHVAQVLLIVNTQLE